MHVSGLSTELPQVLVQDAIVKRREQWRGQDQVGDALLQGVQAFAGRRGLDELHLEAFAHEERKLFRLTPVAIDRKDKGHA